MYSKHPTNCLERHQCRNLLSILSVRLEILVDLTFLSVFRFFGGSSCGCFRRYSESIAAARSAAVPLCFADRSSASIVPTGFAFSVAGV